MATILAIDTSAKPVSCAVWRDDRLLASYFAHTGLTHSQTLMPMIHSVMDTACVTVADVDCLAVSVGPGSFTGVRIGVSAVKGLSFPDNKPCVAVSTLEAMAENVRGLPFEGLVCCVMDARCGQVYTATFEQKASGDRERLTPDEALSLEELKNRLKKVDKSIIFVGDGSEMCYNAFREDMPSVFLAPPAVRFQSAAGVAALAAREWAAGRATDAASLLPTYLRLPQAERELRARQKQPL